MDWTIFRAEFLGTAILILLGNGVVANVSLEHSKAKDAGWLTICAAWGMAVAIAVYCVGAKSGAHINPAVSVALFAMGKLASFGQLLTYLAAQMAGGFVGAVMVYITFLPHWAETEDPAAKLACFSTGPAIRETGANFLCEFVATGMLMLGILGITQGAAERIDPLLVGLLVFVLIAALGGPTGAAMNPARDLGPRIAHEILPIPGKATSDWEYSWIPVVAPILGALMGVGVWRLFGA